MAIVQEMNNRYERYVREHRIGRKVKWQALQVPKSEDDSRIHFSPAVSRKRRQKSAMEKRKVTFTNKTDRTIKYSILSMSIAFVFVILTLPANIPLIAYPTIHKPFSWGKSNVYRSVTNFLEALNYSSNFFIYCIANSEIRNAAWENIKCCLNCLRFYRKRL